jgi:hypothetical protein
MSIRATSAFKWNTGGLRRKGRPNKTTNCVSMSIYDNAGGTDAIVYLTGDIATWSHAKNGVFVCLLHVVSDVRTEGLDAAKQSWPHLFAIAGLNPDILERAISFTDTDEWKGTGRPAPSDDHDEKLRSAAKAAADAALQARDVVDRSCTTPRDTGATSRNTGPCPARRRRTWGRRWTRRAARRGRRPRRTALRAARISWGSAISTRSNSTTC